MHEPVPVGQSNTAERRRRQIKTARDHHLFSKGPKRILSIDGGGVRGIIALKFLEEIESILRARTNNPELCLSDYFDLIGGTSTGAIIASGLALGLPVDTRSYGVGAQILADLGVGQMRLMTNNPDKCAGMAGRRLELVELIPLVIRPVAENVRYLKTKQEKLGHALDLAAD